ncbi:hypothetical protein AAVH_01908 [Aphelenchoides avenae]|nr:hypothetical protein AAVH_01908 [Aphelenchus avenae]
MFSRRGRGGIRPSQALFANPFQQQIYDKLRDFAESKATELNLEPMTREERKLTHDLVLKLGLRSVGRGEEPSRYMTIMRPRSKDHLSAITKAREVTELRPEQQQAIRAYLQKYPI